MKNTMIVTIIIAAIVGGGGFFAGMQYQKAQQPSFTMGQFKDGNMMRQGGTGTGIQSGNVAQEIRPVSGEITSLDGESITIKMPDGSSKILVLSDKTTINKSSEGAVSDLKTGETVSVFGTEGSDGSVTAQTISIGSGMMQMQPKQ